MNTHPLYINCRDSRTRRKKEAEFRRYGIRDFSLFVNMDYFQLINRVIAECRSGHALIAHDDVCLPFNLREKIDLAVTRANREFGKDGWGVLGNAGIGYLSNRVVRFLKDPHPDFIPYNSEKPVPVVHVDGNILLLNLGALRRRKVVLPPELTGFHCYDLVLTMEAYRAGLVCAADSSLFVQHNSGGSQAGFDQFLEKLEIRDYFRKNFLNHRFKTLNGDISVSPDLKYLKPGVLDNREDYDRLVFKTLNSIAEKRPARELVIVTRTCLRRLPRLARLFDSLQTGLANSKHLKISALLSVNNASPKNIREARRLLKNYPGLPVRWIEETGDGSRGDARFPRVRAMARAIEALSGARGQFVWFVDDDDFVFPTVFAHFPWILDADAVLLGDSQEFLEKWDDRDKRSAPASTRPQKRYQLNNYYDMLKGVNFVPVCNAIYPSGLVKEAFARNQMLGDYYEDYFLLLYAQNRVRIEYYPLLLAGISKHGKNTFLEKDRTHWDYSYATFLSEAVHHGVVPKIFYDFATKAQSAHEQLDFAGLKEKCLRLQNDLDAVRGSLAVKIICKVRSHPLVHKIYMVFRPFLLCILRKGKKLFFR